jgi:glycosyltransferase involved in cell wall biosynthesis
MREVSAIINFHAENEISISTIRSFLLCCDRAEKGGIRVQKIAILDNPTSLTAEIVRTYRRNFDILEEIEVKDLGAARSVGLTKALGEFVAFFDGDDLFGADWLLSATTMGEALNSLAVLHPRFVYYFDEKDLLDQSTTETPRPWAKSFLFEHMDSERVNFDARCLYFSNIYTSNTFAPKALYDRFPLLHVDSKKGYGVEDWAWHAATLAGGIPHKPVPDTVHLVRVKAEHSLGLLNTSRGLLPPVHLYDLGKRKNL